MSTFRALLLGAPLRRREPEIKVGGIERLFIFPQRGIVGGHRDHKARRQRLVDEAGAFEFIEAGKVASASSPKCDMKASVVP